MAIDRHRLFFALWADAGVRRQIGKMTSDWRTRLPFRWTSADKLHLTLAFLGDVEPEKMGELFDIGASLTVPPFQLTLDRLDLWRKPEVLCITATEAPEPLRYLVSELNSALEARGFPVEKRTFKPHVTLARRARHQPEASDEFPGLVWNARQWCLAESRPGVAGSPYDILRTWPLNEGGIL